MQTRVAGLTSQSHLPTQTYATKTAMFPNKIASNNDKSLLFVILLVQTESPTEIDTCIARNNDTSLLFVISLLNDLPTEMSILYHNTLTNKNLYKAMKLVCF